MSRQRGVERDQSVCGVGVDWTRRTVASAAQDGRDAARRCSAGLSGRSGRENATLTAEALALRGKGRWDGRSSCVHAACPIGADLADAGVFSLARHCAGITQRRHASRPARPPTGMRVQLQRRSTQVSQTEG